MMIYNPSGVAYFGASTALDWMNTMHTASGAPGAGGQIWYASPASAISATLNTAQAIGASGYRTNPFFTPPYYTILKEVAVRVTAALVGIPTASGLLGLYDNSKKTSFPSMENAIFPRNKLWQFGPFQCDTTGIYRTGVNIILEPNSIYWLCWAGTRNSTMTCNTAASMSNLLGYGSIGVTTPAVGLSLGTAQAGMPTVMSEVLPATIGDSAAAVSANTNPNIYYRLESV